MKKNDLEIKPNWNALAHFEPDFQGASIISADGTETPITEKMIQAAFDTILSNEDSGGGPASKNTTKTTAAKGHNCHLPILA